MKDRNFTFYTGVKGQEQFQKAMMDWFYIEEVKTLNITNNEKENIKTLLNSELATDFTLAKEIINNLKK